MSHKDFLKKFRETISKKHNQIIEDEYTDEEQKKIDKARKISGSVQLFRKKDIVEKDQKLEEMKEWINPQPMNNDMINLLNVYSQTLANRKQKAQEVQAIIDILSDPLILRHKGYK